MANEVNLLSDASKESKVSKTSDTSKALIAASLTLYQCKNGALVKDPRECEGTMKSLPELSIGY